MPLIQSQMRTPGGPSPYRPHIVLLAVLVGLLVVLTHVSGWVG